MSWGFELETELPKNRGKFEDIFLCFKARPERISNLVIRNFLVIEQLFTIANLFTIYLVNWHIGQRKWFTIAKLLIIY